MKTNLEPWISDNPECITKEDVSNSTTYCFIRNIKKFVELYCENESEDLKLSFYPASRATNSKNSLVYASQAIADEDLGFRTRDEIFERDINELRKIRPKFEDDYKVKLLLRKNDSLMEIEIIFWDV